ncbi:MAG: hypothetical protein EBY26_00220 [Microbacteriaceae bacterium]|nr:hypothetical protein [Microbacteriaceae bacterium]
MGPNGPEVFAAVKDKDGETSMKHLVGDEAEKHMQENPVEGGYQGLLDSPYVGTGSKKDPSVSKEERRSAITDTFGVTEPRVYVKRFRSTFGKTISEKVASKHIDKLVSAVDEGNNDLPMNVLAEGRASAVVSPSMGRSYSMGPNGHMGLYNEKKYVERVVSTPAKYGGGMGEPVYNPNFFKQVGKKEWYLSVSAHNGFAEAPHASFLDHQGQEYKLPYHDGYMGTTFTGSNGSKADEEDMKPYEGHQANIFPGKGEDTEEYVTHTFKVPHEIGASDDLYRTYHTRHKRVDGVLLQPVHKYTTFDVKRGLNPTTIAHELGHALDYASEGTLSHKYSSKTVRSDPMSEAVADGVADRHSRMTNIYDEDVPQRSRQLLPFSGYSTNFSKWRAPDRALYAAVRTHVANSNRNYRTHDFKSPKWDMGGMPSRTAISEALTGNQDHPQGNSFVLGYLYKNHQHVRDALKSLGMESHGEAAAATYDQYSRNSNPTVTAQGAFGRGGSSIYNPYHTETTPEVPEQRHPDLFDDFK